MTTNLVMMVILTYLAGLQVYQRLRYVSILTERSARRGFGKEPWIQSNRVNLAYTCYMVQLRLSLRLQQETT